VLKVSFVFDASLVIEVDLVVKLCFGWDAEARRGGPRRLKNIREALHFALKERF